MWQPFLMLLFAGFIGYFDITHGTKVKKKHDRLIYIFLLAIGTALSIVYVILGDIPTPLKIIEIIFLPISKGMNNVLNQ